MCFCVFVCVSVILCVSLCVEGPILPIPGPGVSEGDGWRAVALRSVVLAVTPRGTLCQAVGAVQGGGHRDLGKVLGPDLASWGCWVPGAKSVCAGQVRAQVSIPPALLQVSCTRGQALVRGRHRPVSVERRHERLRMPEVGCWPPPGSRGWANRV